MSRLPVARAPGPFVRLGAQVEASGSVGLDRFDGLGDLGSTTPVS
ncbi:hypothetical protein [Microbacterium sp. Leaf151]|nr:hypothetical protein [Microbacterium sp. Leaf151]